MPHWRAPFPEAPPVTILGVELVNPNQIRVGFSEQPSAVPSTPGAIVISGNVDEHQTTGAATDDGTGWLMDITPTVDHDDSGSWTLITTVGFVFPSGASLTPGQSGDVVFP